MPRKKHGFGGERKTNPGHPEQEIRRLQEIPLYHDTYFTFSLNYNYDTFICIYYILINLFM
jgi:hypothetical protein